MKRVLSPLTVFLIVLSTFALFDAPSVHAAQSPGKYFDNVVTIVMENEGICDVFLANISYWGMSCGGGPNTYMPYATRLAQNWTLAEHYNSTDYSGQAFSMKNYLAMFSGSTWGCLSPPGDADPNDSNTCTGQTVWTKTNLVDRLPASVSWKAYMENMTSNCQMTDSGTYTSHHDPFVYFKDIVGNSTRCGQVIPAGTNGSLDSSLLNDLNSASAPNFMWLTPNLCDDMHTICTGSSHQIPETCNGNNQTGCCSYSATYAQCLPVGDAYLRNLVPQILSSYTFTHKRSALFITFDEGGTFCPNGTSSDDCVYAVWAGPVVKKQFYSPTKYGHFSWLKTIGDNWGFTCLVNDCYVSGMGEFFIPSFSLSTSPSSISILCTILGCSPASTVPSNLTVTGLNGFTGLVNLTYVPPANSVSGVYVTGPSTANVPVGGGPVLETLTSHGSGTTSGTFVWTINGHSYAPYAVFSITTTLTVQYTWCAHCTLPGH